MQRQSQSREFRVTGRLVLLCLLGFFGIVFAVNGAMVYAAKSTFGGVETASSYKAGLYFNRDIATAKAQQQLGWQVDGGILRGVSGDAVLDIRAMDRDGAPLTGLVARARLIHPTDARYDREFVLADRGAGQFRGEVAAPDGQWELAIDLYRGERRMFRSLSRVILR